MKNLTIESIIEAKRLIGDKPVLVGIVCSPAFAQSVKRNSIPAFPPSLACFAGVEFFTDYDQTENFKPFYDHQELRDYLSRNTPLTQTK